MHRKVPLTQQVYALLYPGNPIAKADAAQPLNFESLARQHLSKEARHEARTFYGEDGGLLLRIAGLDYNLPHIRRRLVRCRHHRRLFAAFDTLRLTKHEIYELCTWDCTLWQRNKILERHPEQALAAEDDTGADVPTWEEVESRRERQREHERVMSRIESVTQYDRVRGQIAHYLDVDERLITPRAASIETQDATSQSAEGDREKLDEDEAQVSNDGGDDDQVDGDEDVEALEGAERIAADETDGTTEETDNEDKEETEHDVFREPPGLEPRFGDSDAMGRYPASSSQPSVEATMARVQQIASALVQG